MRSRIRWSAIGLIAAVWLTSYSMGSAQLVVGNSASIDAKQWSRHHCLFVLGLPGDPSHQEEFRKLASGIHQLLKGRGFPDANFTVLTHNPPEDSKRALSVSNESIKQVVGKLVTTLTEEDSIWVIFIGHADHDGEHARFHIPGPDLRAIDYADLFEGLKCKQQVFWLTMSSSGWFTEPLSKVDRIVVTATTRDAEPNETEFPAAFATALASPTSELDRDNDGEVSVLELFASTHELIDEKYRSNSRAPTEHATIDDNADGKGTEWKEILAELNRISQLDNNAPAKQLQSSVRIDGQTSATVLVPNLEERISAETTEFGLE